MCHAPPSAALRRALASPQHILAEQVSCRAWRWLPANAAASGMRRAPSASGAAAVNRNDTELGASSVERTKKNTQSDLCGRLRCRGTMPLHAGTRGRRPRICAPSTPTPSRRPHGACSTPGSICYLTSSEATNCARLAHLAVRPFGRPEYVVIESGNPLPEMQGHSFPGLPSLGGFSQWCPDGLSYSRNLPRDASNLRFAVCASPNAVRVRF